MGYLDLHLILSPMYTIPENWWHLNLKVYKWMQCQSLPTLNLPVLSYRHLPLSLTDKHRQENQGSKERGWLASLFSWRITKTWFILFLIKYAKWRLSTKTGQHSPPTATAPHKRGCYSEPAETRRKRGREEGGASSSSSFFILVLFSGSWVISTRALLVCECRGEWNRERKQWEKLFDYPWKDNLGARIFICSRFFSCFLSAMHLRSYEGVRDGSVRWPADRGT